MFANRQVIYLSETEPMLTEVLVCVRAVQETQRELRVGRSQVICHRPG